MYFNENYFWRDKIELQNLRLSELPSTKVLLKLESDTEDQVLLSFLFRIGANGILTLESILQDAL